MHSTNKYYLYFNVSICSQLLNDPFEVIVYNNSCFLICEYIWYSSLQYIKSSLLLMTRIIQTFPVWKTNNSHFGSFDLRTWLMLKTILKLNEIHLIIWVHNFSQWNRKTIIITIRRWRHCHLITYILHV